MRWRPACAIYSLAWPSLIPKGPDTWLLHEYWPASEFFDGTLRLKRRKVDHTSSLVGYGFDHHLGMSTEIHLSAKSLCLRRSGRLRASVDTLSMSGVNGLPWSIDRGSLRMGSDLKFRSGVDSHEGAAKESTYA
jgi:hypothetical protein